MKTSYSHSRNKLLGVMFLSAILTFVFSVGIVTYYKSVTVTNTSDTQMSSNGESKETQSSISSSTSVDSKATNNGNSEAFDSALSENRKDASSSAEKSHLLAIADLDREGIFSPVDTEAYYKEDYATLDGDTYYKGYIVGNSDIEAADNFIVFKIDQIYADMMKQEMHSMTTKHFPGEVSPGVSQECLTAGKSITWYHYCVNASAEMADDRVYVKKNAVPYLPKMQKTAEGRVYCHMKKQVGNNLDVSLASDGVDYCVYMENSKTIQEDIKNINPYTASDLFTKIVNSIAMTPNM